VNDHLNEAEDIAQMVDKNRKENPLFNGTDLVNLAILKALLAIGAELNEMNRRDLIRNPIKEKK
jgi:hypothetical protein